MANVYVRSGAAGAATGADWANAYLTLAAAFTAKAAGDSFWVSEDHAETQATNMNLSSPGISSNPCFAYCVNHSGSVPPVSADLRTTATITTTSTGLLQIPSGYCYFYGIIFSSGSGANSVNMSIGNGTDPGFIFKSCALRLGGTTGGEIVFDNVNASAECRLTDTTVQFASTAAGMAVSRGKLIWRDTASAITGATFPTSLFLVSTNWGTGTVMLDGVDLSALGSGKTIVGAIQRSAQVQLKDCKLGASVTVAATPFAPGGSDVTVVRADSGATNYRTERYRYEGTQTVETTIVRTSGASDGTTTIAWKLITTANSKWVLPFEALPMAIWNDSTSAITTLTIYGTTTGGGVPKDDEIWVEVEYLGSSLTPQGSFITSSKADNLAASAATNNSSDASTWGGGGAGNGFKIVVPSFTPGMKGTINITVKAAKASATYYIDPKPSISGISVSKSEILSPGVYANEISSGGGISRARAASGF